jgi:RHS repeat-associated protein
VQAVYTPQGNLLALMNGQTFQEARLPLVGGSVARYFTGTTGPASYWHPDWLGTSRLTSTQSRTVGTDAAFAPFGEQYVGSGFDSIFTGSAFQDKTGDLRDFLAREYHPTQGRWISPDPAGLAAVDLTDPQTWNRYGYVRNNPLGLIDPNGLDGDCAPGVSLPCTVTSTAKAPSTIDWFLYQIYFGWYCGTLGLCSGPPQGGGGGPGGGVGSGTPPQKPAAQPANNTNCSTGPPTETRSIVSGSATTSAPMIGVGAAIGGLVGGPPGAFLGGILGSFFGVGGNVSYVPSTNSLYAGATLVLGLGLSGGSGIGVNAVMVPSTQNPNSIASSLSFSLTYQPRPFLGSTVTKSPGSGPPVVGPSVGTRIPVSGSVSYNFCLTNCGCGK